MDIKRRNVLAGSLGAAGAFGLPIKAGADGRLYGRPGSISDGSRDALEARNLLQLPLARANLPPQIWDQLLISGELWARVVTDTAEARRFRADPDGYLLKAGIDPALLASHHSEVAVLRAIIEPEVLESARSGDYRRFARAARRALDTNPTPSRLKRKLVAYLESHREKLERHLAVVVRHAREQGDEVPAMPASIRDIRRLQELVRMPLQGTGIAEVNVVVDINFAVNFNVLAIALALALAAVAVGLAVFGEIPAPIVAKASSRIANLDPELMKDFNQTVEVAVLLGHDNFVLDAVKDLIDVETDAFLQALQEVGIVVIEEAERPEALQVLQRISYRRAGLAAA
jgi:hypothetical protein